MYEAANEAIYDTAPQQHASLAVGVWSGHSPQVQQIPKQIGDSQSGLCQTGVVRTRGHCAGNGGLRGHSVGGVFPCVIYATGNVHEAPPKWAFKAPDGSDHTGFDSYESAYLAAGIWLDNRPVSFEPQVNV